VLCASEKWCQSKKCINECTANTKTTNNDGCVCKSAGIIGE